MNDIPGGELYGRERNGSDRGKIRNKGPGNRTEAAL